MKESYGFEPHLRFKGTVKMIRGALIKISSTEFDFIGFESLLPVVGGYRGSF